MPQQIPQHVALPPRNVVGDEPYRQLCWDYLQSTLTPLAITVEIDDTLKSVCLGAFEIRVDGAPAVYDYSDYLLVDGSQKEHQHWFRFHYTLGYRPHDNLSSFPPISFLDWGEFERLRGVLSYDASGDAILHSQTFEFLADSSTTRDRDLYFRRKRARDALLAEFGSVVRTERLPQQEFWRSACAALMSIHVPGSWLHSLDRGQHQLLGFGVCTLSPEIWTALLNQRIEPYTHYVPVRDDLSDLLSQVEWCRDHRSECAAIGRRAKAFFLEHSTPEAIWAYVAGRLRRGIAGC